MKAGGMAKKGLKDIGKAEENHAK
jgi:hypothetical protein